MDFMQNQQQQAYQQMQEAQQQLKQEARQQLKQGTPQQLKQETPQQLKQEAQLQLNQQVQMNFPPAHADAAAAGEAVQQMAPARKTYKARRAEKRHAEEARKYCPVGDSVTYDIKHQLEDYHTQKINSMRSYFPVIKTENNEEVDISKNLSGVDMRVLQYYCHGYKTNRAGKPASADDRRYQREDQEFFDAFCSTDYVRRAPYLQRMVEEFLSYDLKENMFSDQSLQNNAARYKSMGNRIVYFENIMKDKNNAFFFDSPLCPVKKEVLDKALKIAICVTPAFATACQKRGVEPDKMNAPYIAEDFRIDAYSLLAEDAAVKFKGIPEQFKSLKESIRQEEEEQTTPEMYQQMYSLIKGDVQKLLDCDVKKLEALSEEELRKLYSVSLGVDKCLALKHPLYDGRTMRDELIGQRELEYEYKSAVLRGLVEKADGFRKQGKKTIEAAAARYQKQMMPGTDEFLQFFDSLRCMDLNHRVSFIPPKFAAVTRKFNAVPEEEHQRKIAEARRIDVAAKRMQRTGKSDKARKITETMEPLLREGKIAEAMERLQSDWYHSLAYSQEQLKDMNMPSNIGEPLFRSFDGFLTYEAAQTLLTPEQFEQMLFNLGAGAGLDLDISEYEEQLKQAIEEENDKKKQELEKKKNDAEEQRDEAIKMNNAGLDTLREVLTAQYDMLERKYGSSLEQLTIKELMEHYVDIGRDFTNGQQDLNMADKYPGFIREGNLEDKRLYNQIQYYRRCSYAIDGLLNMMPERYIPESSISANMLEISDENIQKYMYNMVTLHEETTAAREYLMQNKDSFHHPLDWSQKVKNPADGN
ncbi:MAG: hypothetical protein K2J60_08790 [Acetatifactor sp.]|nr:hypothetical protein [Acetatifactor sp.]